MTCDCDDVGDPGATPGSLPRGGFPGALYVIPKSVIGVGTGGTSKEDLVISVPPAGAIDVFIRYRDPTTGSAATPSGNERFRIYAVQRLFSLLVDTARPVDQATSYGRVLAVRDTPADSFDIKLELSNVAAGVQVFYDVVVIGWAKEPTGMGALPITTVAGGDTAPNRVVSIPLLAYGRTAGVYQNVQMGGVGAQSGFTAAPFGLNTLPLGIYHASPPVLVSGDGNTLELDASGNLKIREQFQPVYEDNTNGVAAVHDKPLNATTYNATAYDIITAANTGTIKASAGNLYRAYFTNSNAAAQIYALVNKASNPATGDVPIWYFRVPPTTTFLLEWKYGKRFSIGIAWAQVTAVAATITTTGTSDTVVDAEYI